MIHKAFEYENQVQYLNPCGADPAFKRDTAFVKIDEARLKAWSQCIIIFCLPRVYFIPNPYDNYAKWTVIGLELQTIIYVKIHSQGSKFVNQNEDIIFESKQDGDLWEGDIYTY